MLVYDPTRPLVSLHLPKTGGTSFRQVLQTWFPEGTLHLHYSLNGQRPERHDLKAGDCVHGHFNGARGFGVWHYDPEARQCIAFFREPFDLFLSYWFFIRKQQALGHPVKDLEDDPSFEVWLLRRAADQAEGHNRHSFVWQMPVAPGTEDLDRLLDERFVFVGIMERYEESVTALARLLGRPLIDLPHVNTTERDSDFNAWRRIYERWFPDEYDIYEKARARNAALIAGI